jgi:hypothetical protein
MKRRSQIETPRPEEGLRARLAWRAGFSPSAAPLCGTVAARDRSPCHLPEEESMDRLGRPAEAGFCARGRSSSCAGRFGLRLRSSTPRDGGDQGRTRRPEDPRAPGVALASAGVGTGAGGAARRAVVDGASTRRPLPSPGAGGVRPAPGHLGFRGLNQPAHRNGRRRGLEELCPQTARLADKRDPCRRSGWLSGGLIHLSVDTSTDSTHTTSHAPAPESVRVRAVCGGLAHPDRRLGAPAVGVDARASVAKAANHHTFCARRVFAIDDSRLVWKCLCYLLSLTSPSVLV